MEKRGTAARGRLGNIQTGRRVEQNGQGRGKSPAWVGVIAEKNDTETIIDRAGCPSKSLIQGLMLDLGDLADLSAALLVLGAGDQALLQLTLQLLLGIPDFPILRTGPVQLDEIPVEAKIEVLIGHGEQP